MVYSANLYKMKSTVSYYGMLEKPRCCRILNTKYLALLSGIYTLNISILVVLMFGWQINANFKRYQDLGDVYYGIQIAQIAIIATQFSMVILSIVLIFGIHNENATLVVPWIIGFLTFMSLETVAMVYSNVLRDHIFKTLAMWSVIRYHHLLRSGVSWKINKNIVEL
ncbi:CLUMA_CG009949, isoform A [Clunio marinus]|uniref:CLUMA_CG009949, isoform A n=1 Tax=Clunio marinus TaxID=568069 RepID=A0A1J1IA43_9DIPT|nr:CLUMA_CG009949, isoform A [Clunio marinus]